MTKMMMSAKNGGLAATDVSPHSLLQLAIPYSGCSALQESRNGSSSDKYDIDAKVEQVSDG